VFGGYANGAPDPRDRKRTARDHAVDRLAADLKVRGSLLDGEE
jgi:hypothetical protein